MSSFSSKFLVRTRRKDSMTLFLLLTNQMSLLPQSISSWKDLFSAHLWLSEGVYRRPVKAEAATQGACDARSILTSFLHSASLPPPLPLPGTARQHYPPAGLGFLPSVETKGEAQVTERWRCWDKERACCCKKGTFNASVARKWWTILPNTKPRRGVNLSPWVWAYPFTWWPKTQPKRQTCRRALGLTFGTNQPGIKTPGLKPASALASAYHQMFLHFCVLLLLITLFGLFIFIWQIFFSHLLGFLKLVFALIIRVICWVYILYSCPLQNFNKKQPLLQNPGSNLISFERPHTGRKWNRPSPDCSDLSLPTLTSTHPTVKR